MLIAKNFLTAWPSYKPSYLVEPVVAGGNGLAEGRHSELETLQHRPKDKNFVPKLRI